MAEKFITLARLEAYTNALQKKLTGSESGTIPSFNDYYTEKQIDDLLASLKKASIIAVKKGGLPTTGEYGVIYLESASKDELIAPYEMWVYEDYEEDSTAGTNLTADGWIDLGSTEIDLSGYLTEADAANTYLPLAGGTLTGALNGTSATFSGDIEGYVGDFKSIKIGEQEKATFNFQGTADRAFTLPDKSGQIALTSDISDYTLPTATNVIKGGILTGFTQTENKYPIKVGSDANAYALLDGGTPTFKSVKVGSTTIESSSETRTINITLPNSDGTLLTTNDDYITSQALDAELGNYLSRKSTSEQTVAGPVTFQNTGTAVYGNLKIIDTTATDYGVNIAYSYKGTTGTPTIYVPNGLSTSSTTLQFVVTDGTMYATDAEVEALFD